MFSPLPALRLRRSGRDCEFGGGNHISRSPCYDNSQENPLSPLTGQSEPLQAVPSPVISTLIPTFRRPALLERAIRSALGQTHQSVRVCVYDNASGDDTAEVVRRIAESDSRVVYSCNSSNIGAFANVMRAMSLVETPYFSILSDDDVLLPEFYATALEGFRKHPEAMMSVTATLQIDGKGRLVGAPILGWRAGLYAPPDGYLAMLNLGHPEWTSVLFRREVLMEAGTLDEDTGAPADLDYLLRIASRFPIVVSTNPGAIWVTGVGYSATPHVSTGPGWLKMIRNQTQNDQLPPDARRQAELVLTKRLTDRIFITNGFYAIVERRWEDARVAARTLGTDHGLSMRASILRLAIWVCERLPLAHHGVVAFCEARRIYVQSRRSQLEKDFGSYSSYLGQDPKQGISGRIGA